MWVETEDGNLVNLDQAFDVLVDQHFEPGKQVLAYSPAIATYEGDDRYAWTTLCSCDDWDHGKRIIRSLVMHIHLGHKVASMRLIADETREGEAS